MKEMKTDGLYQASCKRRKEKGHTCMTTRNMGHTLGFGFVGFLLLVLGPHEALLHRQHRSDGENLMGALVLGAAHDSLT